MALTGKLPRSGLPIHAVKQTRARYNHSVYNQSVSFMPIPSLFTLWL
jgi:hypothetical protein